MQIIQGRLDVHVDFKHASKWQAEGIFKNFYPTKPKPKALGADGASTTTEAEDKAAAAAVLAAEKRQKANPAAPIIPLLDEEVLADLAKRFAEQIPEDEMSVRVLFPFSLSCWVPGCRISYVVVLGFPVTWPMQPLAAAVAAHYAFLLLSSIVLKPASYLLHLAAWLPYFGHLSVLGSCLVSLATASSLRVCVIKNNQSLTLRSAFSPSPLVYCLRRCRSLACKVIFSATRLALMRLSVKLMHGSRVSLPYPWLSKFII